MRKNIVRAVIMTALTLNVASGLVFNPTDARAAGTLHIAAGQEVSLRDIDQPLVPQTLIRGDREFGGNGPGIDCTLKLRVSPDKKAIVADIMFHAKETKSDWSEVRDTWSRKVYDAPAGKTIAGIVGPTESKVHFTSTKAGFQILGPGEDFQAFMQQLVQFANMVLDAERKLSNRDQDTPEVQQGRALLDVANKGVKGASFQGNHVHFVAPATPGPVSAFAIVGDTGGDDISDDNNGKDDTRIVAIKFKKVRVKFSN